MKSAQAATLSCSTHHRAGTLAGFPELDVTADEVLCSHGHDGHGAADAVKLRRSGVPSPFEVETMETGHDVLGGRLRGINLVHIIRGEGMKIVHLGDLGCRLTPEQAELAADADALMIPIGGILTIEPYAAFELCRLLTPPSCAADALQRRRRQPQIEAQ